MTETQLLGNTATICSHKWGEGPSRLWSHLGSQQDSIYTPTATNEGTNFKTLMSKALQVLNHQSLGIIHHVLPREDDRAVLECLPADKKYTGSVSLDLPQGKHHCFHWSHTERCFQDFPSRGV